MGSLGRDVPDRLRGRATARCASRRRFVCTRGGARTHAARGPYTRQRARRARWSGAARRASGTHQASAPPRRTHHRGRQRPASPRSGWMDRAESRPRGGRRASTGVARGRPARRPVDVRRDCDPRPRLESTHRARSPDGPSRCCAPDAPRSSNPGNLGSRRRRGGATRTPGSTAGRRPVLALGRTALRSAARRLWQHSVVKLESDCNGPDGARSGDRAPGSST